MGYGQSFLDLISDYTYGSYGQRPKTIEPLIDILKKEMQYGKDSELLRFLKDVLKTGGAEVGRAYDKYDAMQGEGVQNPLTAGVSSSTYFRPAESTIREQEAYDSSNRDYVIKKIEEMRAEREAKFANKSVAGGPASGGIAPPTDVVAAEKKGETAGDRAISAYKAADKTGGDYTDFSSFMADYVRRAERDTAAADAERATAASVNIDIPGGYESLQRIRQQAGGTPGGGSFSVMESTVVGGDTEEDMRAYVDNYRNTEVDRQIGLIEQAFPAANRPPALDARLEALYQSRSNRDAQATERAKLPIDALRAEADWKQAEALDKYYTGLNEAKTTGDRLDYDAAIAGQTAESKQAVYENFKPLLTELAKSTDPNAGQKYTAILQAIALAPTPQDAYNEVMKIIGGGKPGSSAAVPGQNITGYPDIDAAIAPRPRG